MPFIDSHDSSKQFLVHLVLDFFIFSLLCPEHKHHLIHSLSSSNQYQRIYMTMYLRNIQKNEIIYSFSKTKPSLIWGKKFTEHSKIKTKNLQFCSDKFLSLFLSIIFAMKLSSCNENHPSIPISHKLLFLRKTQKTENKRHPLHLLC